MTSNIAQIAALSFAGHVLQDQPSRSWRLGQPGRSIYAFRVTWAPGMLTVSGDIGSAVYEIWPAFQTAAGAISLVNEANFDYLVEKSGAAKEFDRDATVADLIRYAYAELRMGQKSDFVVRVCDVYGGDPKNPLDRKEAMRTFRDEDSHTAESIYDFTGDFEAPVYSHTSEAHWTFQALKLWARTVRDAEAGLGEVAA